MSKRRPLKLIPTVDLTGVLRDRLSQCPPGDLIDLLVELANSDRNVLRHLDAHIELALEPEELALVTRQAIADATRFDERDVNRNFPYDHAAYDQVKRNLTRLVRQGQLRLALELSLEVMDQGSLQVEASDEGLMLPEIEMCLQVVLAVLFQCDLPREEKIAWCHQMRHRDRVGIICEQELVSLQSQLALRQA